MRPPTVPKFSHITASLLRIDAQVRRFEKSSPPEKHRLCVVVLLAKKTEGRPLSEKCKGQLVLLVAKRRSDFLKERFVAPVTFHDVLDSRDFALQAELRCGRENAAKPFFRQIFQRRLTTARSCQRDIRGERLGQTFRIDSHLRHVAIRLRASEKSTVALMNKDVQDRVVEGCVGCMSVRFPAP